MKELAVVDLFCGVGGLDLGASRAGFSIRGAVDIDPRFIGTHRINFPQTTHIQKDITQLNGNDLLTSTGIQHLTGVIGGPPCQGFSYIGRNNEGDKRNDLFIHFYRVVSQVRPTFFLTENVPGIMASRNDHIREAAMSYLNDDYILLPPLMLAASEYGAPTSRKRVFFIGYQPDKMDDISHEDFHPSNKINPVNVREALHGLPMTINPLWQTEEDSWQTIHPGLESDFSKKLYNHIPPGVGNQYAITKLRSENKVSGFLGTRHTDSVLRRYVKIKPGMRDEISKSRRLEWDGLCPTLCAGTGPERGSYQAVRPLHPSENRVITPREAARLQGFPDWFQFSPTKWHSFRQIGNSVSPILAEQILSVIHNAFSDNIQ